MGENRKFNFWRRIWHLREIWKTRSSASITHGKYLNGHFDWSDLVYTNDKVEIEKYLLKKDDVLFNRTNSPELVGKTAIYKGERSAIFLAI